MSRRDRRAHQRPLLPEGDALELGEGVRAPSRISASQSASRFSNARALSLWNALWLSFALKAAGVALVLIAFDPLAASASLFIVGMLSSGIVILVSGALAETAPLERYLSLWAAGTALFALCQMLSGILIFAISQQGYGVALLCSVAVLGLGAILALAAGMLTRRKVAA